MIRLASVFALVLLVACDSIAPDVETSALRTVVASFDGGRLRDYDVVQKPLCIDVKGPQCNSHSTADLEQIRNVRFDARPKDGWSFAISPVRNSWGKKVVDLYSTIDPIEPGFACGVFYRIVLDASGSRILSSDMISSDFMVSARSNPSGQRSGDQ